MKIRKLAPLIFLSFFLVVNFSMAAPTPAVSIFDKLVKMAEEEMARLGGKLFVKSELEDPQFKTV